MKSIVQVLRDRSEEEKAKARSFFLQGNDEKFKEYSTYSEALYEASCIVGHMLNDAETGLSTAFRKLASVDFGKTAPGGDNEREG